MIHSARPYSHANSKHFFYMIFFILQDFEKWYVRTTHVKIMNSTGRDCGVGRVDQ